MTKSYKPEIRKRQSNLETANEMYKAAFIIKKGRFAQMNTNFSEKELLEKTAEYFRQLNERKK